MDSLTMKPEDIETESFRIIDSEVGSHGWSENEWQVVRRAIHTSADFEYAATMKFSDRAVAKAVETLKSGVGIVTDTTMALAGISKVRLTSLGCRVSCYVADNDVAELARQCGAGAPRSRALISAARSGVTRSSASREKIQSWLATDAAK
ncbi:MAG: precorrin-8X methylmutase, partial [Deltaproteobacteria bacterium]